jgi:hypothetical protein
VTGFREEIEIERITKDEAVRVKKIRGEVRGPQSVKLRREEVVVDRATQNRDEQ